MELILVVLAMAVTQALINDLLTLHLGNPNKRNVLRIGLVLYFGVAAFLKMYSYLDEQADAMRMVNSVVFFLLFFVIVGAAYHMAEIPLKAIFQVFCLTFLISLAGDLCALGVLRMVYGKLLTPMWMEPGGIEAIAISSTVQILLTVAYAGAMKRKNRKAGEDFAIRSIPVFVILLQLAFLLFMVLVARVPVFMADARKYGLIVLELAMMLILIGIGISSYRDQEIRSMRQRAALLEEQNQSIYRYYQELENSYRQLHKLRHDFNNLLNAACGVARQGQWERAEQLLGEIENLLDIRQQK